MTKEEYDKFIDLQDQYLTELEKMELWAEPILRKAHNSDSFNYGRRYSRTFEEVYKFESDQISYRVYCAGDNDIDFVSVEKIFSNKWHKEIQEKLNAIAGMSKYDNEKARLEEVEKLRKRLAELE